MPPKLEFLNNSSGTEVEGISRDPEAFNFRAVREKILQLILAKKEGETSAEIKRVDVVTFHLTI
ncbi:hypothetical protein IPJ72_03350 [Candidatus Peregrinibacteria bacterium]|nr:MAG: hypothetical protein IPJ72_03350 [Candidatus Peregrinibacteria bacterium]